jgi:CheY-like chemotaxis protein
LVVDDDPDWRGYVREALRDLGYDSAEACDGDEALAALGREHFDVVLLDLYMPGMSGEEVATRLPEDDDRKVVFVTSANAQDVSSALGSGGHYYLPKGATLSELSLLLSALD